MSHSREETLFADALGQPAEARGAFLAQACGEDRALLARIVGLLAAHEGPESLIVPDATSRAPAFAEEKPGDFIGRYKLLQKIGEGGCGVVWMAAQQEPVERRVAVKVIKLGMDTREVIARFTAERQALARMDHPGIAKVLDGGATQSGRPYFAMELVRGVPITRFSDEQNLPIRARLELFMRVCDAVQHAHQKGIIHRDLKPSNILVSLQGFKAVPTVIDFGIAKAIQGRLTDASVFTSFDQIIGTPAYMSPEQADTSGLDIDTRSDVYSLGVVLYELLAGRCPFDPASLQPPNRDEIRRLIREVEPPRPSTRFSTLPGVDRANVARQRSIDAARLPVLLSGDLDWIVMKALEKNRARRYHAPTALADDISRHLRHEPVEARPPGHLYRTQKFIRRNRVAVSTALGIALALIAGSVVSIWQAVRARQAERAASAAQVRATNERARADDLLTFMVEELKTPLARVGELAVLDRVIEKALHHFASRDAQEMDDPTLVNYVRVLNQLGGLRADQGRYAEAEAAYRDAHARADMLVRRNPRNAQALAARGDAEWGHGFLRNKRGNLEEARAWFLREHESRAALVALDPKNAQWQLDLARQQGNLAALLTESDPERARTSYRAQLATLLKFRALKPDDLEVERSIANATGFLGLLAETAGDFAEAAERFTQYTAQFGRLSRMDPKNPHWHFKEVESLCLSAALCLATGQHADARRQLSRARELVAPLVARDTTNQRKQRALLTVDLRQAQLSQAEGDPVRAVELIGNIRAQLEATAANEPTDAWIRSRLALALRIEAEVRHALGAADAGAIAARAIAVAGQLGERQDATPAERAERAAAGVIAGRIAASQENLEAAHAHWQLAESLLAPLEANLKDWRVLDPAARLARLLGQSDRAAAYISQLEKMGYVPIEPWPELATALSVSKK